MRCRGHHGYGEELFARAFHADYHTVETVAHARAACACVPDATFVLDIGGQDMKAIWLNHGVLTDIVCQRGVALRAAARSSRVLPKTSE